LYVAKLNNFNPCENTHNDNHQNGVTSYTARRRERRGSNGTEKIIFSDHCASSGQMVITITAVKFSGRRKLRQLLVEAIFKLRQPESEPVLDLISGYATFRMQLL